MQPDIQQQRIRSIFQMLFEMAAGNFTYRIQRTGTDDEIEALIELVNMTAEEMKASIFHYGYIRPHHTYQYMIQHTFILDPNFAIECVNANVPVVLGMQAEDLYGAGFESVLSDTSLTEWDQIIAALPQNAAFHQTLQLSYKAKNGLAIPSFCTVSRLLHNAKVVVSSVTMVTPEASCNNPTAFQAMGRSEKKSQRRDALIIQKLYEYILENLAAPLPTISVLSRHFGTNQKTLKSGFRHFFNTSIYQFYNDERLKRAHLMIQQTTLPLQDIADKCGFNGYVNFCKAFKKKFGYTAGALRRK